VKREGYSFGSIINVGVVIGLYRKNKKAENKSKKSYIMEYQTPYMITERKE